jgi:hypothetical protein
VANAVTASLIASGDVLSNSNFSVCFSIVF